MTQLARRQLAATRREQERDRKKKDRARLRELRGLLKTARARRRERLKSIRENCKACRARFRVRAQNARKRLAESIRRTRERARDLCRQAKATANLEELARIEKAMVALEQERAEQQSLKIWATPKSTRGGSRGRSSSSKERAQESDDQVLAEIDDPGLRIVWERVKHKIKAGPRRSRAEAFFEWAAENTGDVYAIQEQEIEKQIAELEREEYELRRRSA